MAGQPVRYAKTTWNGLQERLAALGRHKIELPIEPLLGLGKAGIDDVLDATAAAWSAWRVATGNGRVLPSEEPLPSLERREVIWY